MKIKQFIKRNGRRILTSFLCVLLLFSMTLPTLAFDGEVGGPVDKSILEEYHKTADVLFNPQNLPVFSAFNHETLYWLIKWPLQTSSSGFVPDEDASFTYSIQEISKV